MFYVEDLTDIFELMVIGIVSGLSLAVFLTFATAIVDTFKSIAK